MQFGSRAITNLVGLGLSIGCVIHCILMPVCIASLPSLGLAWLSNPLVHQALAVTGIVIGLATLIPGWLQHHRHAVPGLALCGLVIMNYAAFHGDRCCEHDADAGARNTCSAECCSGHSQSMASTAHRSAVSEAGFPLLTFAWSWLLAHPTVIGAVLLASAHGLNHSCAQACCRQTI